MTASVDLRRTPVDGVVRNVADSLGTTLDQRHEVRKRRTIGLPTGRGTWVRIERRPVSSIGPQGWNGIEAAERLEGVSKPEWLRSLVWRGEEADIRWRADETTLLPGEPLDKAIRGFEDLTRLPELPEPWWAGLHASLDAMDASREPVRVAQSDTHPMTAEHVNEVIGRAFRVPVLPVAEWTVAHGDFGFANLTAPEFCVFDWEDWGAAPRGTDAAALWCHALATPRMAARIRRERPELNTPDGHLMMLFYLAKLITHGHPDDPRLPTAHTEVNMLLRTAIKG